MRGRWRTCLLMSDPFNRITWTRPVCVFFCGSPYPLSLIFNQNACVFSWTIRTNGDTHLPRTLNSWSVAWIMYLNLVFCWTDESGRSSFIPFPFKFVATRSVLVYDPDSPTLLFINMFPSCLRGVRLVRAVAVSILAQQENFYILQLGKDGSAASSSFDSYSSSVHLMSNFRPRHADQ